MRTTHLLIGATILVAACGADTGPIDVTAPIGVTATAVTATAVCVDKPPAGECVVEASDERVEGTEFQLFDWDREAGTSRGLLTLENEGGSWFGTFTSVVEDTRTVSRFEYVGLGGYQGLVYTFESIFDFATGTATRTGQIQQSRLQP